MKRATCPNCNNKRHKITAIRHRIEDGALECHCYKCGYIWYINSKSGELVRIK